MLVAYSHVGGGPEELRLSYDREERAICVFYNYNSSSDPIYPIGYQASITALTDHIWTSKKRNTPQCIDIPTKFYHNVLCNSFNLTLSLTDFFEEELQRKQLEISKFNIECRLSIVIYSISENTGIIILENDC